MTVFLFARAKDLMGADRVDVEAAATVADLRRELSARYPQLAGLIAKSAFAVNDEFAEDAVAIPAGAEIALLPPVSGG